MARKAGRSGQSNPDEDMGESPGSRPEALQYRGCSFRYGIDRFQFNKPASWTDWLDFFKRYLVSAGLMAADDDFKINELILCMGPEANAILKRSTLSAADRSSFDAVVEMFQRHFLGTRNIVYELARLHGIAENCELDDLKVSPKQLLTQCQLIAGMANRELAAQLQTDPTLTLEQVVQRLRLDATVASQQRVIAETVGDKAGAPRAVQNGQVESVLRQKAPGTARRSRKVCGSYGTGSDAEEQKSSGEVDEDWLPSQEKLRKRKAGAKATGRRKGAIHSSRMSKRCQKETSIADAWDSTTAEQTPVEASVAISSVEPPPPLPTTSCNATGVESVQDVSTAPSEEWVGAGCSKYTVPPLSSFRGNESPRRFPFILKDNSERQGCSSTGLPVRLGKLDDPEQVALEGDVPTSCTSPSSSTLRSTDHL